MIDMSEDDLLSRLATNLRESRRQRGVTREQLGTTAEVDPQLIKRIENGRANPALVVLSRLASALMISLSLMLSADIAAEPLLLNAKAESEPFESEAVGETISSLRHSRHLSRRGLARMIELRPLTLSRYESATTDARILAIEPLARALGVGTREFVEAVELRQRQAERSGAGWHAPAEGVQCRLITDGVRSQLWEWRLAAGTTFVDQPTIGAVEEIATAIRGVVTVEAGESMHRLRRGGSVTLPVDRARSFTNEGASTARLLRFQVRK
jgi:transcriptional regulator with XRE-family HTH domain